MNFGDMDNYLSRLVSTPIFVIDEWLVNPTDNIDLIGQTIDLNDQTTFEYDIPTLKKYIKHAKTPLEKRRYEKMLNSAYKQRKGRVHDRKTEQAI